MKKFILSFATAIAISLAGPVFAGAGHSHGPSEPVSTEQASQQADMVMQQMVDMKKVSSEWSSIKGGAPQQRSTPAGNLWVVEYANPEAEDKSKSKLFVFVDEFGNPIGANHTGEL